MRHGKMRETYVDVLHPLPTQLFSRESSMAVLNKLVSDNLVTKERKQGEKGFEDTWQIAAGASTHLSELL